MDQKTFDQALTAAKLNRKLTGSDELISPTDRALDGSFYLGSTFTRLAKLDLPVMILWPNQQRLIYNRVCALLLEIDPALALTPSELDRDAAAAWLARQVIDAGGDQGVLRGVAFRPGGEGEGPIIWLDLDYGPLRGAADQPDGVVVILRDAAARVRLEQEHAAAAARLNAAALRQRCLIDLGRQLRSCETAAQIAGAMAALLGDALGCSRAGYAVIRGRSALVEADWTDGAVASLSGEHKFAVLGPGYVEHITRGETLVVPDLRTHPVMAESVACWAGIGVQALVNAPLAENGVTVAVVYVHQSEPRSWNEDEVALVQEVADRTWEAMGRARAVEALRKMNDGLEAQVRERTLQRDRMWTLSADVMMVTDREGVIVSVNPAWTRLLGWREDELVGARFTDFVHPDDLERTLAEREGFEQGRPVEKFENRYLAKDGRVVWLSWKATPDGDLIHSAARDVTAEREQAEALRAAEDALRQAQKMEAVGQLTGGIAHDFNNLLQGVLGALELSERRIARGQFDGLAKYNAQAQQCAQRAAALTHRLLAFSRRQSLDPRPVDANQLILAMEPLLRHTLGESIRLTFDLAADLWRTMCDPNQLDSAILNLAINARDAMPGGGVLTIQSRNDPAGAEGAGAIRIAVSDTGTGMTPEVLARAFDPFFTTKAVGQGTGLGLSMVYGFMRQSGGEAKIASTPGHGATVSLHLRRHHGQAATPSPATSLPALQADGQGVVLVLEDEPAVRVFILDVLRQLGFSVIEASDGPSGLEILQSEQPIDLLVTDIGLPGLNGRQVAEAARRRRPSLKILFMTGYAEAAATSEGFLETGMALITKPFAIDGLVSRIDALRCA